MLKNKIEFTYEPIKNIFEEISKVVFDGKDNIFKVAVENMNENGSINESWINAVDVFETPTSRARYYQDWYF